MTGQRLVERPEVAAGLDGVRSSLPGVPVVAVMCVVVVVLAAVTLGVVAGA
jgi:hypothetical protein